MAGESRPVPSEKGDPEAEAIGRMIRARRIAVVGLSDDPSRPSFGVAGYLLSAGKEVLPVNPNCQRVLGLKCYASLSEVPGPIDLVDVFRRPEFCADVVREAVAAGARGVWLQSGIMSPEARELACRAGIDFVQNRCLMVEHMRHAGSD
jgi:predicted CoA-binding protein